MIKRIPSSLGSLLRCGDHTIKTVYMSCQLNDTASSHSVVALGDSRCQPAHPNLVKPSQIKFLALKDLLPEHKVEEGFSQKQPFHPVFAHLESLLPRSLSPSHGEAPTPLSSTLRLGAWKASRTFSHGYPEAEHQQETTAIFEGQHCNVTVKTVISVHRADGPMWHTLFQGNLLSPHQKWFVHQPKP